MNPSWWINVLFTASVYPQACLLLPISVINKQNLTEAHDSNLRICDLQDVYKDCTVCSWNVDFGDPINPIHLDDPPRRLWAGVIDDRSWCDEEGGQCHDIVKDLSQEVGTSYEVMFETDCNITSSAKKKLIVKNMLLSFVDKITKDREEIMKALSFLIMVPSMVKRDSENLVLAKKLMMTIVSETERHLRLNLISCNRGITIVSSLLACSDILLDGSEVESPKETAWYDQFVCDNASRIMKICSLPRVEGMMKTRRSFIWTWRGRPSEFLNLSDILRWQNSYFELSPSLITNLVRDFSLISVQFISIKNKLFWNPMATPQVVSLTIEPEGGERLHELAEPIDIYFRYDKEATPLQSSQQTRYIPSEQQTMKNLLLSVYSLEPLKYAGSGKVIVSFHKIVDSQLKVLMSTDLYPDFEMMAAHATEVSNKTVTYHSDVENQNQHHINYLGILSESRATVEPHSFEVRYIQCHSKVGSDWFTDGCYVGNATRDGLVHCRCRHLSLFGGSVAISPRQLDLETDVILLLNVKDDPRTFILVGSIIMLYFMMLVWTRHNDGKDRLQRYVVVLEDNFPGEEWPYLITVYTGAWIGAGTGANVILRLYGTRGISRAHNLQSKQRKVLKANCDDWFLIFTQKNLGDIQRIYLFTDHSGSSPDWYCSKIMVYDLQGQKDFKFVIEKWISLREEDEWCEHWVEATPTQRTLRRDRIALDNIIFGLRETHLLISIFTRHPRTSVTRSQRLSICVCILLVHMLTSIMFYQLQEEEYPQYSNIKREIIIQMESSLLASPFTFIVIFCFKKSRIVTAPKADVPMTLTSTQAVSLETGLAVNQSWTLPSRPSEEFVDSSSETTDGSSITTTTTTSEKSAEEEVQEVEEGCWKNCYQQLKTMLFQEVTRKSTMPVQIAEEDEESTRVRNQWMFFAWLLCETAIFSSAVVIIIYSMKMDPNKCREWMRHCFKYATFNIAVFAPLKIMIFATILAILYGQLQYIASYECNIEAAMKRALKGNDRLLSKILKTRKDPCYRPLKSKSIATIRKQEQIWRRWRIIINFMVISLLYLVLSTEVSLTWDGLYVQTRENLVHMLDPSRSSNDIRTFDEYLQFCREVLYPAFVRKTWYINVSNTHSGVWLQEMGFMSDCSSRLVGVPRVRQQRVDADSCNVAPPMTFMFSQCNAPMTWSNMDRRSYANQWTLTESTIDLTNSPWRFVETAGPFLICGSETRQCYPHGGYSVDLDYDKNRSMDQLQDLYKNEWLDGLTRVVFFELTVFNVNSDLISFVSCLLEKTAVGSFYYQVKTDTLHPKQEGSFATFFIIFTFTSYYCLRIVLLFNRSGMTYLFSWTGLSDVFLNALLYSIAVSLFFYSHARQDYLHQWQTREEDDLQLTTDLFTHRELLRYETAVLALTISGQFLHNFRFGRKYFVFFKAWSHAVAWALCLGVLVCVNLGAYVLLNTVNNTPSPFCSLGRCFGSISYSREAGESSTPGRLFQFTTVICIATCVVSFIVAVTIIFTYADTKRRCVHFDEFNMFSFICGRIRNTVRKLNRMRRVLLGTTGGRSRAGADSAEDECPVARSIDCTRQMCAGLNARLDVLLEKTVALEKTLLRPSQPTRTALRKST